MQTDDGPCPECMTDTEDLGHATDDSPHVRRHLGDGFVVVVDEVDVLPPPVLPGN